MRWPLRYQILLPFAVLLLGTVAMISALDAYFSARNHRHRVQSQLRNIVSTITPGRFPLTNSVLQQTHQLSGAHYVVASPAGQILASSVPEIFSVPSVEVSNATEEIALEETIQIDGVGYLHTAVRVQNAAGSRDVRHLHILYPEQSWRESWRENVYPPLVTGGVALGLATVLSVLIAAGVSRPVGRLTRETQRVVTGNFQTIPEPRRNDEIRDLVRAINQMAVRLVEYEGQLQRDAQLAALGQLRGGLAHKLRNAVTGCRMALDLSCLKFNGANANDEALTVAQRQLVLIERYLDEFLNFGAETKPNTAPVDLRAVAKDALSLLLPTAEHGGVEMEFPPGDAEMVCGNEDDLRQVVVNLSLNALDAVNSSRERTHAGNPSGVVRLSIDREGEQIRLIVADDGPGPEPHLGDAVFEPLVTAKPHGVGLGLASAKQTVQQHGGSLKWERVDKWTRFIVLLPPMLNADGDGLTCPVEPSVTAATEA